jgi:RNA polymerase sigma-70 factor (ECF subfamily)
MSLGARLALEATYRADARRVLATLIKLLGGFDEAEEAMHEAFAAAAEQWPRDGVPDNPTAWLVSTGRFRTIDRWRRNARLAGALPDIAALMDPSPAPTVPEIIQDDELRLIFICCHPALAPEARAALTLREVAGLTTEEIARAWLVSTPTVAQRIVRAKARIREARLPFELPPRAELPQRLDSVLQVIYLIFNEGYASTQGPELVRADLCAEAIRLGRLLRDLLDEPEVPGLLALMLLHEARRATRVDANGDVILLEDQDRSQWNRDLIAEAQALIAQAFAARRVGGFLLQAAIAATHAAAPSFEQTDWPQIVSLYDLLVRAQPSSVVALNRAVAIGLRDGPAAGLAAVRDAMAQGNLDGYPLAHAALADMHRRLQQPHEARLAYRRALALTRQPADRRFLQKRLDELPAVGRLD